MRGFQKRSPAAKTEATTQATWDTAGRRNAPLDDAPAVGVMESGTLVSTVVVLGPESVPGGVKLDPERLNGTEREEDELRGGGVTEGEVGGELGVDDGDELVVRPEVGVDDSEWLTDARAEGVVRLGSDRQVQGVTHDVVFAPVECAGGPLLVPDGDEVEAEVEWNGGPRIVDSGLFTILN